MVLFFFLSLHYLYVVLEAANLAWLEVIMIWVILQANCEITLLFKDLGVFLYTRPQHKSQLILFTEVFTWMRNIDFFPFQGQRILSELSKKRNTLIWKHVGLSFVSYMCLIQKWNKRILKSSFPVFLHSCSGHRVGWLWMGASHPPC